MGEQDKQKFFTLISGVYAFYRQDVSTFALNVWWEAMKPFDYGAVSNALTRHSTNPDNGQFMPKPADIIRLLRGSTQDSALVAWAKVDKALRTVGVYRSVVFDDPIINAVIRDMGGWAQFGNKTEDEWPFVAREFENRYRGYRGRESFEHPKWLPGIAEAHNRREGQRVEPPVMIGNEQAAKQVFLTGQSDSESRPKHLAEEVFSEVLFLENKESA